MLRQKKNADGTYNENSYNSSDEVNNIQWNLLKEGSAQYETMQYYKGLMAFRKESAVLRQTKAAISRHETVCELVATIDNTAFVEFTMHNAEGETLLIVYNAENKAVNYTLPAGNWDLYITGTQAGTTAIKTGVSGAQKADPISCYVYKLA